MRVAQLAEKMGVTADTVRFYTRVNVLRPVKNKVNGYKEFGPRDEKRLHFALCARKLGFTVEDIRKIIDHSDCGKSPCSMVRALLEERLVQVEKDAAQTRRLYKRMREAVQKWKQMPDGAPNGKAICTLIENWDSPDYG